MNRKLPWLLTIILFASTHLAEAQHPKKVSRIGYLSNTDSATESPRSEGIRLALRELGYIEGENIAFEYRYAEGKRDQFPKLAAELVRLKVDIIVAAGGARLIQAAMNATKTIAVVMTGGGASPVEAGVVESLARPGGNVTGFTNIWTELGGKRLELLKEAVPKLARIAFLYDPASLASLAVVKEIQTSAPGLKLTLQSWEIRDGDNFDRVFAAIGKQRPDGVYVIQSPLMNANRERIAKLAIKTRLPSVFDDKATVDAGGLMFYGADLSHIYQRVASYVDKILKGAKPADLPVEQPRKFEFIINLRTAKQIGLTIPPNVLARADKVIR